MYGLILLGVGVLICGLTTGISALRGLSKSGVRLITVLLSAVAALITCAVLKGMFPSPTDLLLLVESNLGTIEQFFGANASSVVAQMLEYVNISPTLVEFVIQLVGVLLLPLACLLLFMLYSFLTWLVYLVVTLIFRRRMKEANRKKAHSRWFAAALGLAQGLIIVGVLFLPISSYLSVADTAVTALVEQDVLDQNDGTTQAIQSIVAEANDAPVLSVYRTLGGNAVSSSLMKMKVAGMDVKLEEELDSVTVMFGYVMELSQTELQGYGEEEAQILLAIGDAFDDSKLLTPIAGEILYAASNAWMNGEAFLGIEKPNMGESNALFEPFIDALLEIVNEDAQTDLLLQGDVKTITEMAAILSSNGVLANLNNTDDLLATLSGDGMVKELVQILGTNNSMKRLIPEMTNLGVRAIGQVLSIPQNADAVYESFMDDVTVALNDLGNISEAEQIATLSDRLNTAFDEAGIVIDDEVLELYATSMTHDLVENNPNGQVTSADVKAFFLLYADHVTVPATGETVSRPSYVQLSHSTPATEEIDDSDDIFAGTVYANMTEDARKRTAAAVLAGICTDLSRLDGEQETFSEQAKTIVVNAFTDLLGEGHSALEAVKTVEITQPISDKSIQNTASMKSSETMKKTTTVVTVEDLLIDSKAAANNITLENISSEADAIAAIFNTAGSLVKALNSGSNEKMDITTVTDSLGTILDSLKGTGSFGEEKTAGLFTAVLQSKTVRETVGLDMKTATEMANKATEGGGNYSQTLGTVAGSLGIMEKLQNNEKITDEELVDFMKNLTPQSAGMFQIFVTGDRLVTYGVPEKHSGVTADLVSSTFTYMSREDLKDYDKEAKALNVVLQMSMSAKDSDDKKLFSSTDEAEDGKLPTAKTAVFHVLDSEALRYSFVSVLTDGEKVTNFDPFGIGAKMNHGSQDYIDCQNAIYEYRDAHPEVDDLVFEATAALFGVEIDLN